MGKSFENKKKGVKANPMKANKAFSKKNSTTKKNRPRKSYDNLNVRRIGCKAKRLQLIMIKKYDSKKKNKQLKKERQEFEK